MFSNGKEVIGRLINTTLNAGAIEVVFKDPDGNAHVYVAGERVLFESITSNNRATAKDVTFFQDTDGGVDLDSGEEIAVISHAAAGPAQIFLADGEGNGLPSKKINAALTNKFYAVASAAGGVDILVKAAIVRS